MTINDWSTINILYIRHPHNGHYHLYFQPTVYALDTCVQLALENSGGAFKLKVAEIGTGRKLESLYAKAVINVISTEPMLSVSVYTEIKTKLFRHDLIL